MNVSGTDVRYTIGADTSPYQRAVQRIKSDTQDATAVIGKAWSAIGVAGVAALGSITAAIVSGTKSMAEYERLQLRTSALIKATGNAAGFTTKELTDFASALDLKTLADRNMIMGSINVMQTFKKVQDDVFLRSIELSQDLSEVLGTDMKSSVVMLGKALEDPIQGISALRRVGVSFTDTEKEQIKALMEANNLFGAQSKILDTLAGQVGGAGVGAAGGLSGQIDTFNFRLRQLTETMSNTSAAVAGISAINRALETMINLLQPDKLSKAQEFFRSGYFTTEQYKAFLDASPENRQKMLEQVQAGWTSPHEQWRLGVSQGGTGVSSTVGGVQMPAKTTNEQDVPWWMYESTKEKADVIQQRMDYIQDQVRADIEEHKKLQEDLHEYDIEMASRYDDALIQGHWETEKAMYEITKDYNQRQEEDTYRVTRSRTAAWDATLSFVSSAVEFATSSSDKQNKKQFEQQKTMSTGLAIISTAAGAARALSDYQYPYSLIVMGAVLAAGLVQIQRIQSQSYNGGSSGLSAPGGGSVSNQSTEPAYGDSGGRPSLNINIEGDFIGDEAYIDKLVDMINDAADRDVYVNQSKYAGSIS
jgi:hypothetical protein